MLFLLELRREREQRDISLDRPQGAAPPSLTSFPPAHVFPFP
ncbi:hypothetical protein AB0K35_09155 [Micromonospora sp. NPDC053740]